MLFRALTCLCNMSWPYLLRTICFSKRICSERGGAACIPNPQPDPQPHHHPYSTHSPHHPALPHQNPPRPAQLSPGHSCSPAQPSLAQPSAAHADGIPHHPRLSTVPFVRVAGVYRPGTGAVGLICCCHALFCFICFCVAFEGGAWV